MSDPVSSRETRPRRRTIHHVPSPLDPFLRHFLIWVGERADGFNPTLGLKAIAEEFDWQPAFAEVIFTSARSRGLVQPRQLRGTRGKINWSLSPRGLEWLNNHAPRAEHVNGPISNRDE